MTGPELRDRLVRALAVWEGSKDELRDLDAALGDGDLGITVSKGAAAAGAALTALDGEPEPAQVLRTAAAALASANPSTFAALGAGALMAAARPLAGTVELDRSSALTAARAGAAALATRGKSEVGDKTVLDALVPSLNALEAAGDAAAGDALAAMVAAARRGVEDTTALQSQRGRAAWVQERSVGLPDPGATAYLRLVEALQGTWHDQRQEQR